MSVLSPDLLAAFRATHYLVRVSSEQDFTLRIGCHSRELESLHALHGATCSAYLTAWNPLSVLLSADENQRAQDALRTELHALNIPTFTGYGREPASSWPGEEHILAIGLSREQAISFGKACDQHAVLWSGPDATPELLVLA